MIPWMWLLLAGCRSFNDIGIHPSFVETGFGFEEDCAIADQIPGPGSAAVSHRPVIVVGTGPEAQIALGSDAGLVPLRQVQATPYPVVIPEVPLDPLQLHTIEVDLGWCDTRWSFLSGSWGESVVGDPTVRRWPIPADFVVGPVFPAGVPSVWSLAPSETAATGWVLRMGWPTNGDQDLCVPTVDVPVTYDNPYIHVGEPTLVQGPDGPLMVIETLDAAVHPQDLRLSVAELAVVVPDGPLGDCPDGMESCARWTGFSAVADSVDGAVQPVLAPCE